MPRTTSFSLDECTASQLGSLLKVVTGFRKEDLSFLATQAGNRSSWLRLLDELCEGMEESGEILVSTVCDPDCPLEILMGLKEFAKNLFKDAVGKEHQTAATLLYHLVVAAAVARHGVNISSRPVESRLDLYGDLASITAGEEAGKIFGQAVKQILLESEDDSRN